MNLLQEINTELQIIVDKLIIYSNHYHLLKELILVGFCFLSETFRIFAETFFLCGIFVETLNSTLLHKVRMNDVSVSSSGVRLKEMQHLSL